VTDLDVIRGRRGRETHLRGPGTLCPSTTTGSMARGRCAAVRKQSHIQYALKVEASGRAIPRPGRSHLYRLLEPHEESHRRRNSTALLWKSLAGEL